MSMRTLQACLAPLLLWLPQVAMARAVPAQETESSPTLSWVAAAKSVVAAKLQSEKLPGLSCAVGKASAMPVVCGFGYADLENDVPATGQTVYRLASISKPITALCVMRLVERGAIDLDRPVHELVPTWPEKEWVVTTRQLLAHLGGVRHYRLGEGESTVQYASQTAALVRFAADPLLHEPGTKHHYSTFGYNLAAAVAESAAKKPFPELVRELVAEPSGAATLQDDDVRRIIRGRAQGYVKRGGQLQNSELMDSSYKLGGGGLCCSAEDLVRVGQAIVDGKIVSAESLAVMWERQRTSDGEAVAYGLGFRVGARNGRRVVMHSGAQSRVSTLFYILPDERIVIALLCNLEGVQLLGLAEQLADLAMK